MPRASLPKSSPDTPSRRRLYRFAGLTILSRIPLPELPPSFSRPRLTIVRQPVLQADVPRRWDHVWRLPGGAAWMRVAAITGAHVIRFDRYAEFLVTPRRIVIVPRRDVPVATIRHLLLDQVLPAVLGSAGALMLHASAVDLAGVAVAFAGAAGAGKSTIAAALAASGAAIVADDALALSVGRRGVSVRPTYPGVRLWPGSTALIDGWSGRSAPIAHYSPKRRWTGRRLRFASAGLPLGMLFVLGPGQRASVSALSPRLAALAVVRHGMMLDPEDRRVAQRVFEQAVTTAACVPVFRLTVPRGRRGLQQALALVRNLREPGTNRSRTKNQLPNQEPTLEPRTIRRAKNQPSN